MKKDQPTSEIINITPDKSIYSKLGQTGYSVGESIAEFIDNAIDARFDDKVLNISISLNKKDGTIIIEDDARGMDKETAKKCLVLAYSDKKNQLGEFGLGLKTAAQSLGNYFNVTTTSYGSNEEYFLEFDYDEWRANKDRDWTNFEMKIKDSDRKKNGTRIIIKKLKIKIYPNLITNLKAQLSERFSPYIENNEIRIRVNQGWVTVKPIELVDGSKEKISMKMPDGSEIDGWYGLLKIGSQKESGFNLYRYNRLIRAHEKLGYQYHPSKMWIMGELNLDSIPVTHNKREFIIESKQYQDFLEIWKDKISEILQKAQARHREVETNDLPLEEKETLKDNFLRAINRIDEFKDLAFPSSKEALKRGRKGKLLEKEKRDKGTVATIQISEETAVSKGRTPRKTQKQKVRFIVIADKKFRFDWDWDKLEEDIPKVAEIDEERKLIMVWLNKDFKLINALGVSKTYITFFVAEALSEIYIEKNNKDKKMIMPLRDKTLCEVAKIITEDEELDKKRKELEKMEKLQQEVRLKDEQKKEEINIIN